MEILRCDEKVEDIEDFVGKRVAVTFRSNSYNSTFTQKGVIAGFLSIYNPLDYVAMEDAQSDYPGGAGPILVSRIEKVELV